MEMHVKQRSPDELAFTRPVKALQICIAELEAWGGAGAVLEARQRQSAGDAQRLLPAEADDAAAAMEVDDPRSAIRSEKLLLHVTIGALLPFAERAGLQVGIGPRQRLPAAGFPSAAARPRNSLQPAISRCCSPCRPGSPGAERPADAGGACSAAYDDYEEV